MTTAPIAERIGLPPRQRAALTLITCGGNWDAGAGLYVHGTVVTAVLVG